MHRAHGGRARRVRGGLPARGARQQKDSKRTRDVRTTTPTFELPGTLRSYRNPKQGRGSRQFGTKKRDGRARSSAGNLHGAGSAVAMRATSRRHDRRRRRRHRRRVKQRVPVAGGLGKQWAKALKENAHLVEEQDRYHAVLNHLRRQRRERRERREQKKNAAREGEGGGGEGGEAEMSEEEKKAKAAAAKKAAAALNYKNAVLRRRAIQFAWDNLNCKYKPKRFWVYGKDNGIGTIERIRRKVGLKHNALRSIRNVLEILVRNRDDPFFDAGPRGKGCGRKHKLSKLELKIVVDQLEKGMGLRQTMYTINAWRKRKNKPKHQTPVVRETIRHARIRAGMKLRRRRGKKSGKKDVNSQWAKCRLEQVEQFLKQLSKAGARYA